MTMYKYSELDRMYGGINYENKVVLDIGADYGSTAFYFLSKGARFVVASECDPERRAALLAVQKCNMRIVTARPVFRSKDIQDMISIFRPDIIKIDCEGCERHIFNLPDLGTINAVVSECHSENIYNEFLFFLTKHKFNVIKTENEGECKIISAKK